MFYLTGQILVIVLLATFAGLALGWWSRGLTAEIREETSNENEEIDPFGARSRLEQCHRNNANLRRDLQDAQQQLEQLKRAGEMAQSEGNLVAQLQASDARISALLGDLQMRDDTIAVLERELEKLRS